MTALIPFTSSIMNVSLGDAHGTTPSSSVEMMKTHTRVQTGLDPRMVTQTFDQFGITDASISGGDQAVAEALALAGHVYQQVPQIERIINEIEQSITTKHGRLVSDEAVAPASPTSLQQAGLKHFTLRMCELIERKQHCTYNVLSDALIEDLKQDAVAVEEKNVRRRVYDALNVLDAIGVVKKESSKEIRWVGWPLELQKGGSTNSRVRKLYAKREKLLRQVKEGLAQNHESSVKLFCLSNLILRNKDAPLPLLLVAQERGIQAPNPFTVPFMMIVAPEGAKTDVNISDDGRHAELDFNDSPYQIFDDMGVMRMMGLGGPCLDLMGNTVALHQE